MKWLSALLQVDGMFEGIDNSKGTIRHCEVLSQQLLHALAVLDRQVHTARIFAGCRFFVVLLNNLLQELLGVSTSVAQP